MRTPHLLFLMLINLAWGFNIVPTRLALMDVPPITAALVRFVMVGMLCAPAIRWVPGRMGAVLLAGLVAGAAMFSFNNAAFALARNVSVLAIASQLGVPFSLILAIVFLGERIHAKRIFGILLSFAGVVLLSFDPKALQDHIPLLLACMGSFVYATGTILMRRLTGIAALNIQGWLAAVSILPLLFLSMLMEPGAIAKLPTIPIHFYGYIFFSALASSVIGHAGLTYLLQRYPVTIISPLTLLSPILAVVFSVWLLGGQLTHKMMLGGVITLIGVAIITLRNAQTEKTEPV